MVSDELLEILRSPSSGERLTRLDADTLTRLNGAVEAGTLRNRSGERITRPLDGGLLAEGEGIVYPIFDDIPDMVSDEAIEL